MKNKVKITLEYLGHFTTATSQDYKVIRIDGAPTVQVIVAGKSEYRTVRVGDLIVEAEAEELSTRVEMITVGKKL